MITKNSIGKVSLFVALALLCSASFASASEVTGTLTAGASAPSGTSGSLSGSVVSSSGSPGGGGGGGGGSSSVGGGSSGGGGGGFIASAPAGQVLGASTGPTDPGLPNAGFRPHEEEGTSEAAAAVSLSLLALSLFYLAHDKKLAR